MVFLPETVSDSCTFWQVHLTLHRIFHVLLYGGLYSSWVIPLSNLTCRWPFAPTRPTTSRLTWRSTTVQTLPLSFLDTSCRPFLSKMSLPSTWLGPILHVVSPAGRLTVGVRGRRGSQCDLSWLSYRVDGKVKLTSPQITSRS